MTVVHNILNGSDTVIGSVSREVELAEAA